MVVDWPIVDQKLWLQRRKQLKTQWQQEAAVVAVVAVVVAVAELEADFVDLDTELYYFHYCYYTDWLYLAILQLYIYNI